MNFQNEIKTKRKILNHDRKFSKMKKVTYANGEEPCNGEFVPIEYYDCNISYF